MGKPLWIGLAGLAGTVLSFALGLSNYRNEKLAHGLYALGGVLLVASAGAFLWPWLRRLRFRWPIQLAVKNRSALPTAGHAIVPAEVESLRAENAQLQKRLEDRTRAVENRETDLRSCHQRERFGEALPEAFSLNPDAFRRLVDRLHELKPSLQDLAITSNTAWSYLAAQIRELREPMWRMLIWRVDRVENAERQQFREAVNAFVHVLDVTGEDPRPYLAGAYRCYRRWRTQIEEIGEAFAHTIPMIRGSTPWMDAERQFLAELRRKLALPALSPVQKSIEEYDLSYGPLKDPPEVISRAISGLCTTSQSRMSRNTSPGADRSLSAPCP